MIVQLKPGESVEDFIREVDLPNGQKVILSTYPNRSTIGRPAKKTEFFKMPDGSKMLMSDYSNNYWEALQDWMVD